MVGRGDLENIKIVQNRIHVVVPSGVNGCHKALFEIIKSISNTSEVLAFLSARVCSIQATKTKKNAEHKTKHETTAKHVACAVPGRA